MHLVPSAYKTAHAITTTTATAARPLAPTAAIAITVLICVGHALPHANSTTTVGLYD